MVLTNDLQLIFRNPVLMPAFYAYLTAQILKVILTLILSKKLDFRRFIGAGGMPSSHSSTVVALAVSAGIRNGWDSTLFGVAMILAIIVMYDAAGVRRAAGRQAELLNHIVNTMRESGHMMPIQGKLKELLGHKPIEVLAGALLGAGIAILYTLFT